MDGRGFDELTRRFAQGTSRRKLLKGLIGLSGSAAIATAVSEPSSARRGSGSSRGRSTSTTPPPCPDGTISCDMNSTGCCADCDPGWTTCGYDCCELESQCCDGECCPSGSMCVAEETCCPDSQVCFGAAGNCCSSNQVCCEGVCIDPAFPCCASSGAVDCEVEVSEWSICSAECGVGTQSRTVTITVEPSCGGSACPDLATTKACTAQACDITCQLEDEARSDGEACSAGYHRISYTTCSPCPAGTVPGITEYVDCVLCGVGAFASSCGSTTCNLCPPGTFQDQPGMTSCKLCAVGYYQGAYGQMSCQACDSGCCPEQGSTQGSC